jgi:hypothetical protein
MWESFKSFFNSLSYESCNTTTHLKVKVRDTHVADLYYDEETKLYRLIYNKSFNEMNLPSLNPEDLPKNGHPEISKSYESESLWFVFRERLNSLERADVASEIAKYGLTKDSNKLVLLAHIGRTSIAKAWYLELVVNNKKSS